MAVEIRLLEDQELRWANHFFNRIYQVNRTDADFDWEFMQSPSGKVIYVAAIETDVETELKIVGIQCAIPIHLVDTNGDTILTAKSEDTLVDPAYRGQKLFERMYDVLFAACRAKGIQYIWGFTPAVKAFERIGFEIPFRTSQALLVLKPGAAYTHLKKLNSANKIFDKLKIYALSMASYFKGALWLKKSRNTLSETGIGDKTALYREFYGQGDKTYYTLNETAAYMQWRLAGNPYRNQYLNFIGLKNNATEADIIVNIRSDVSYIEQVIFSPRLSLKERAAFVHETVNVLRKKGCGLVRVLCFENNPVMQENNQVFKMAGFTYLKRGNFFVWKSLDDAQTIHASQLLLSRLFTQGNI